MPRLSIGSGVVAVKDSAVVSLTGGTATPAGSVAFSLCKVDAPGLCTTGGTAVGTTNLTGATYPATVVSPTAYVTSVGRYCWRAVFSGDAANGIPSSSDSSATECFTVDPVTPTLSTTAGPGGNLGSAVTDSATLGGTATQPANPVINLTGTAGPAAGGTITFKLYGPNTCADPRVHVADGPGQRQRHLQHAGPQFVPTSAGTYYWVAVYSGSSPNTNGVTHNAIALTSPRTWTSRRVPSTMTTAQAWVPSDSATISAADGTGNLAGTVSFALYASSDCAVGGDAAIYSTTAAVAGASPQTVSTFSSAPPRADGHRVVLVVGELRQRQSRPARHPGQLPRDNGPDDHERRLDQQPVIAT